MIPDAMTKVSCSLAVSQLPAPNPRSTKDCHPVSVANNIECHPVYLMAEDLPQIFLPVSAGIRLKHVIKPSLGISTLHRQASSIHFR